MNAALQFREISAPEHRVKIYFDDVEITVAQGSNLAAALLVAGVGPFRKTPVSGAPRAPFCMMGACFDCLVEIDGVVRQACMIEVSEGMRICRPRTKKDKPHV